jgi:hypothetical protein
MADANFRVKNTLVVNNSFVANSTVVNAAAITATSLAVGANVTVNATAVFVGNASINTNITAATITINGTNVNTAITGNAATAYSNGVSYVTAQSYANTSQLSGNVSTLQTQITGNAATAYTNATTFSANASNITNGTLPNARLGANVVNTSAAFTITGVHTYNANIVFGSASGIVANGSIGTSGQILASNGSSVYWTTGTSSVRQTFTATAGQNTFSVTGGYTPSLIDVYYNGAKLINGTEVTISSGTDVVLATNAANGATVDVVGLVAGTLSFVNAVAKTGDTMTGTLALPSNGLTVGTTQLVAVSGSVGVNTASPSATLTVAGTANVSGSVVVGGSLTTTTNTATLGTATYFASNGAILSGTSSTIGNGGQLQLYGYNAIGGTGYHTFLAIQNSYGSVTNGKKFIRLSSAGSIEVVNDAYNAVIFTIDNAGNVTAGANITAYSDIRLKANIHPIQDAISKIKQLQGVSYERKSDGEKKIGFIAQDLQNILPEVVIENENGLLSVDYGNIVALLTEAIKEQQEKIETLENKVNSLFGGSV